MQDTIPGVNLQGSIPSLQGGGGSQLQPAVAPNQDPQSLQNTMVTPPAAPAPAPIKTPVTQPSSQPAGGGKVEASTAGAPEPKTLTPVDSSQFANYLQTMQDKLKSNNILADARAKLITQLYDRPLTAEELASLPPGVASAISSGDKRDVEMQIRLLNDQIQGRTNSLDSSVKFLSSEYDKSLETAETNKQNAISNVVNFVQQYGDKAGAAMKSLYGQSYIDQLKTYGIDVDNLASIKTLSQANQEALNGTGGGSIIYSPNDPSRIVQNNNLIAAAMSTGSSGNEFTQALDKAGISWQQGNAFSDNPNMSTIKINGDPIEAARAILANSNSIQNWYINHSGKDILAQYGVKTNKDFQNLSLADQNSVIKGIYKGEGGKGDLAPVESDVQSIADAIQNGIQPPVTTGLYKLTGPVRGELAKRGFNLAKAQTEWNGAQAFIKNLNSTQMIKFNGLATSVVNTIDEVKNLAQQMQNSGLTGYNAAKLATLMNTAGNSPQGQLAAKYIGAVNTLKEEFANLANGGYAPTEAAWSLANQQINGNYGVDQLSSALDEVQRLINFRVTAINNQQPNIPTTISGVTNTPGGQQSLDVSKDPLGLGL